jgi:zinc transporter ZupT
MFGLFSALSLPIGAVMGAIIVPPKDVTARWLALGAGALVFSVATQIYGNTLFTMLAISRKYGPFDEGCDKIHGISVCDEKFWNMVVQIVAGLAGAASYYVLDRWLQQKLMHTRKSSSSSTQKFETAPESQAEEDDKPEEDDNIALSIWLGMLLDSIPEALMLGLMTNRHQLSFGFLFSIFLANFPEAFSGASILQRRKHRMSVWSTIFLWSSIFVITGFVAMVGSFTMPENCGSQTFTTAALFVTALLQGLTGGAMLAMMATAMLPEAYRHAKHAAGLYFVFGFVISVLIQTLDSYLAGPQQLLHAPGMLHVELPDG